ncbi:hypothetical protein CHU98_g4741 [Xylaria longipes]|nr:hypothetical protein CHU98_g4741 [Xylaria longipes]
MLPSGMDHVAWYSVPRPVEYQSAQPHYAKVSVPDTPHRAVLKLAPHRPVATARSTPPQLLSNNILRHSFVVK